MPLLRLYRRRRVRLGRVLLDAYIVEKGWEEQGDVLDILADIEERFKETHGTVVEIVERDAKTGEERLVTVYTVDTGELLFTRPARLKRVYLVEGPVTESTSPVPLRSLTSYAPAEELYVYIGDVVVEGSAGAVLLETDKGSRLIWLRHGMKKDSNSEQGR